MAPAIVILDPDEPRLVHPDPACERLSALLDLAERSLGHRLDDLDDLEGVAADLGLVLPVALAEGLARCPSCGGTPGHVARAA